MNKTNSLILAGIIIAGIVIALAWSAVNDGEKNSGAADVEIIGEWYQVYYEVYDQYGNYEVMDQNDAEVFDYTIAIYQMEGTSFIAEYNGDAVVGTYSSGIIQFNGWFGGQKVWFTGTFVDDSTMYATTVYQDRVDGFAAVAVYSTDINAKETHPGWNVDISGDWECKSAKQVSTESSYDLEGTDLKIEKQTDSVFHGSMEQNEGTEIVDNLICGSFAGTMAGEYMVAYFIDESLNVWTMLASEDQLICHIADRSETEQDIGSMAVVQRVYTRGAEMTETVPTDVSGTWYGGIVSYIDNDYYFGTGDFGYKLIIEMMDYGMIKGVLCQDSGRYEFVGFVYGKDTTYINFNVDNYYNLMCYGYLDGDRMIVSFYSEYSGWYSTAASTIFTKNAPTAMAEEDMVGYWYNIKTLKSAIRTYGTKIPYFYSDSAYMLDSLIITDCSDNMFHGWFKGQFIAGSYSDGDLNYVGYIGDSFVTMKGRCTSDGKIVMVSTYRDADGKGSMTVSMFNKNWYSYGNFDEMESNYSGEWEGTYLAQFNGETLEDDFVAGNMVLRHRGMGNYAGTMTQVVGESNVAKSVWLSIFDDDGCGVMVDETGITWSVNFTEAGIVALAVTVTDGGNLVGDAVAAERFYGETDVAGDFAYEGVWKSSSSKAMNADGTVSDRNGLILTITEKDDLLFSATVDFGFGIHGCVGYVEAHGDSVCMMSKEKTDIISYGYLQKDGSILFIQFMTFEEGQTVLVSTLTSD